MKIKLMISLYYVKLDFYFQNHWLQSFDQKGRPTERRINSVQTIHLQTPKNPRKRYPQRQICIWRAFCRQRSVVSLSACRCLRHFCYVNVCFLAVYDLCYFSCNPIFESDTVPILEKRHLHFLYSSGWILPMTCFCDIWYIKLTTYTIV